MQGKREKSLHNVAFHSDLCLGITMADTASVLGMKARAADAHAVREEERNAVNTRSLPAHAFCLYSYLIIALGLETFSLNSIK